MLLLQHYIGRGRDLVAARARIGSVDSATVACRIELPLNFNQLTVHMNNYDT